MPPKKAKGKKPQKQANEIQNHQEQDSPPPEPQPSISALQAKAEQETLQSLSEIICSYLDSNFAYSNTAATKSSLKNLAQLALKNPMLFEKAFLIFFDRLITFDQDDAYLKILAQFLHVVYKEFMTPKFEPIGPNFIRSVIKHLTAVVMIPKVNVKLMQRATVFLNQILALCKAAGASFMRNQDDEERQSGKKLVMSRQDQEIQAMCQECTLLLLKLSNSPNIQSDKIFSISFDEIVGISNQMLKS